jgi:hypothetical protein
VPGVAPKARFDALWGDDGLTVEPNPIAKNIVRENITSHVSSFTDAPAGFLTS